MRAWRWRLEVAIMIAYAKYLHEGKLHHLTRNDMKALLDYIVPRYPQKQNETAFDKP